MKITNSVRNTLQEILDGRLVARERIHSLEIAFHLDLVRVVDGPVKIELTESGHHELAQYLERQRSARVRRNRISRQRYQDAKDCGLVRTRNGWE